MIHKKNLDRLYRRYSRRRYVHPDPLEFLYDYPDVADREIVGLVASSLAYGRVSQILKDVKDVLDRMDGSPHEFVRTVATRSLGRQLSGFRHRFTNEHGMVSLFSGMKRVLNGYGSFNECVVSGIGKGDVDVVPGLAKFVDELRCEDTYLVPIPGRGSACKRLNLFLRWMVRKDNVDPGGWQGIPASRLIVPLDTHMAAIGQTLKMTQRRTPNMLMARDITDALRKFAPRDPVKYDFCLTRFGIRREMDRKDLPGLLSALPLH